jgi:predicted MFS family arabinose efflux permease
MRDCSSAQAMPGQPAGVAPWRVLTISCLAVALCFFIATAMGVLLPTVAQGLQASPAAAPWLVLAYWMATASLTLVFGRISDLWGRKAIFCGGLLLFAVASGLSALSPNAPLMLILILRALQGVAAAAIFANTATMVAHAYAGGPRLGTALGQLATAAALAQAAGPALGALIGELWGWRSVFGLTAVLALALLPLAWAQLPDDAPSATQDTTFDAFGALLCSAALGTLCWGLTLAGRGQAGGQAALFLALGSGTLWALWQWVQRTPSPLVAPQLLRDPARWGVYVSTFAVALAQQGPLVVLALYSQLALGRSVAQTGAALSGFAIGMASGAVCATWLTRRWPPQSLCMAAMGGMQIALLGLLLSLQLRMGSGEMLMLWALGVGTALYVTPANQLLMEYCPPAHRGVVNALRSALQNAGILAGIAWLLSSVRLGLPPSAREALYAGSAARTAGALVAGDLHKAVMLALASLVLLLAAAQAGAWWLWRWHPSRNLPSTRTRSGIVEV